MNEKRINIKTSPLEPDAIEKRNKIVTIRFTEEEKEVIDKVVKDHNTTITDLMRKALFFYLGFIGYKDILLEKDTFFEKLLVKLSLIKTGIDNIEQDTKNLHGIMKKIDISKEDMEKITKKALDVLFGLP